MKPPCFGQMHNLMTKKCDCDATIEALCGFASLQDSVHQKLNPPKKVSCRVSGGSKK